MSVSAQTRGCNAEMVVFLEHKVEQLEQQLATAHRDATEEVAKAHKRGWEQCKMEAVAALIDMADTHVPSFDAIASMKYINAGKHPANGQN